MAQFTEHTIKEIMHQKNCSREDAIAILSGEIKLDNRGIVIKESSQDNSETNDSTKKSNRKR
jgi:hypothetical protein